MKKYIITIGIFIILSNCASMQNSLSTKPILRINTEMHTAIIRRIAIDKKEKYLVTASGDKTLKVWELPPEASPNTKPKLIQTEATYRERR